MKAVLVVTMLFLAQSALADCVVRQKKDMVWGENGECHAPARPGTYPVGGYVSATMTSGPRKLSSASWTCGIDNQWQINRTATCALATQCTSGYRVKTGVFIYKGPPVNIGDFAYATNLAGAKHRIRCGSEAKWEDASRDDKFLPPIKK